MHESSHVGQVPAELPSSARFSVHFIVYIQGAGVGLFRRRLRDVKFSGVFGEDPGAQPVLCQQVTLVFALYLGPGFQLHRRPAWAARVTPAGIGFGFAPRVEVLEAAK